MKEAYPIDDVKEHYRHVLLFLFRKGIKATDAMSELCAVYGDSAISYGTCKRWFARFRSGNVTLKDCSRTGRPVTIDDAEILDKIKSNRHVTTREIARSMCVDHSTVAKRLKAKHITKKLDKWIPHDLSKKNITDRIAICKSLLKKNSLDPFLKRIITGDEKWVIYNNVKRRRSWCSPSESPQSVPKPDLRSRKVMLSIWWDWKGILYYELLPSSERISANKYCSQLEQLKKAVLEKRPQLVRTKNVVFHHDNASPHTALATKSKLEEFDWEVMQHPPYSPDIAPTDYHLFRSLQNHLNNQGFHSLEDVQKCLDTFFAGKTEKFYEKGIMTLPQRWKQVIDRHGKYLCD